MHGGSVGRLDCLIIGGGPAGLTAALYLARFERRFMLVDSGESRAAWIPATHNFPVFSHGVAGTQMLALLQGHVQSYGVERVAGRVSALRRAEEGFEAEVDAGVTAPAPVQARTVLMATGAVDCDPAMPDLAAAMRRGLVRFCPICDGYEARGKAVGVIGYGDRGLGEAEFMARSYADDVTLLTLGEGMALTAEQRDRAARHRIKLVETPIAALEMEDGRIAAIRMGDGRRHRFDTLYAALGLHVRSELALSLGAAHDDAGALIVDAHNQTSVDGLYAAGDTVSGLNQIVVAMGHAAVAATAIHNRCSPDAPFRRRGKAGC
jgi:thioredoxin reductase (NADPH)